MNASVNALVDVQVEPSPEHKLGLPRHIVLLLVGVLLCVAMFYGMSMVNEASSYYGQMLTAALPDEPAGN